MRHTYKTLSTIALLSIMVSQCFGFGTGSHHDLTRTVLTEHGFRDSSIKIVQVENWLTDYFSNSPTYSKKHKEVLEKLHFDNLISDAQVRSYWAFLMQNLKLSAQRAAADNDAMAMFVTLGIGLHAVQDFYAHSNWVELHPRSGGEPFTSETYLSFLRSGSGDLPGQMVTGKYPSDRVSGPGNEPVPKDALVHGDYLTGLNKDSAGRHGWAEAYVFAYFASQELVGAMEKWTDEIRPGFWNSVAQYPLGRKEEEKLDEDVTASRNISMWLKAKGQDGNWKGEGSGTVRFFTAFSSKWVSSDSSVFVKALRDGQIQDQLASGLYSGEEPPRMPEFDNLGLRRRAVLVRVSYVAENNDRNILQKKLSFGGGSDFYSRILIGEQEYWGRTIQKSREAEDPWFEIHILDRDIAEIPLIISVWDEDHVDFEKDDHVDINPAEGVFDVDSVLRFADGAISGDLKGDFDPDGYSFATEGTKPDKPRAVIRGVISQIPIR